MMSMVIEELLRQGLGAIAVCPGSRSTPLAVAVYRHSTARAMTQVRATTTTTTNEITTTTTTTTTTEDPSRLVTPITSYPPPLTLSHTHPSQRITPPPPPSQVIHDERSAGFYALGCARAGILCAIIVTSGTAVSNLLPALSEAREAGLPIILLTADRPAESRDVGEYQTIKQTGLFSGLLGWERDIGPLTSEAPRQTAQILIAVLADVAFGIGEMALRRRQSVQFNFQIRKNEIDPEPLPTSSDFNAQLQQKFCPKLKQWLWSVRPYTVHCSVQGFLQVKNHILFCLSILLTYSACVTAYSPIYAVYAVPISLYLCLCA